MSELVTEFVKKEREILAAIGVDIDPPAIANLTSNSDLLIPENHETRKDDKVTVSVKDEIKKEEKVEETSEASEKAKDEAIVKSDVSSDFTLPLTDILPPASLVEPEELIKWKAERAVWLTKKDDEEAIKIAELREIAKQQLEKFYVERDSTIDSSKLENMQRELGNLTKNEEQSTTPDWNAISKMCLLLQSSKSAKAKDTSRMKKLLSDISNHTSEALVLGWLNQHNFPNMPSSGGNTTISTALVNGQSSSTPSRPMHMVTGESVGRTLYEKLVDWGREEHRFKLAYIFYTNH